MHESSLMHGLMRRIEEIAHTEQATRVTSVRIRLGALSNISPEHFREHFDEVKAGSVAEHADLEFVVLDDINDPAAQDIVVESLEVEEPS